MARRILVLARQHVIAVVALFMALGGTSYAMVARRRRPTARRCTRAAPERYKTRHQTTVTAKGPIGSAEDLVQRDGRARGGGVWLVSRVLPERRAARLKGATGQRVPAAPSVLGSPGTKGDNGAKGDTGASGPKGETGAAGAAGPRVTRGHGGGGAAGQRAIPALPRADPSARRGNGSGRPSCVQRDSCKGDGSTTSSPPQPLSRASVLGNPLLKISGLGGRVFAAGADGSGPDSVGSPTAAGSRGVGSVDTTVFTADGQDHQWSDPMVGTAPAPARRSRSPVVPADPGTRLRTRCTGARPPAGLLFTSECAGRSNEVAADLRREAGGFGCRDRALAKSLDVFPRVLPGVRVVRVARHEVPVDMRLGVAVTRVVQLVRCEGLVERLGRAHDSLKCSLCTSPGSSNGSRTCALSSTSAYPRCH